MKPSWSLDTCGQAPPALGSGRRARPCCCWSRACSVCCRCCGQHCCSPRRAGWWGLAASLQSPLWVIKKRGKERLVMCVHSWKDHSSLCHFIWCSCQSRAEGLIPKAVLLVDVLFLKLPAWENENWFVCVCVFSFFLFLVDWQAVIMVKTPNSSGWSPRISVSKNLEETTTSCTVWPNWPVRVFRKQCLSFLIAGFGRWDL